MLLGGRYEVSRVLSAGGMGKTFIARDNKLPGNPECVVKQLRPASNSTAHVADAKRLFANEAKILAQIGNHHEQIPQLLAYFEEDKEFYLVQEYIEGHPLNAEMLPGKPWGEKQVVQLLKDVLEILSYVHSQGVIHRDIKPENLIRRQQDDKLVLIDFGAVKQVGIMPTTSPRQISKTLSIGTPGYMPAEQSNGHPSFSSDIYALGVTAITALTGMKPMELPTDINGEFVWQDKVQISKDLARVIRRMVRYHFKSRYGTAAHALIDLEQLGVGRTVPYRPHSKRPPQQSPPAQSKANFVKKHIKKTLLSTGLILATGVAGFAVVPSLISSLTANPTPEKTLREENEPSFGGDHTLNVGVLTTQYNPEENYQAVAKALETDLSKAYGTPVQVELDVVDIKEAESISKSREKVANQEWDLAFATAPLTSASAEENGYKFAARMFPKVPQFESALFVRKDSPIQSLADLTADTVIALGQFDSASSFYMPFYDLYGKAMRVNLGNVNNEEIINKVTSGEADLGAGAYTIIARNPELRVITQSRAIPISGVYLSPQLSESEQNNVTKALLSAPSDIQEQAKYGEGNPFDYSQFLGIVKRVDEIKICADWQETKPVTFYCAGVVGQVNGFARLSGSEVQFTVQGRDGQVYQANVPQGVLDQVAYSGYQPESLKGQTIQIQGVQAESNQGTPQLLITAPEQLKILEL